MKEQKTITKNLLSLRNDLFQNEEEAVKLIDETIEQVQQLSNKVDIVVTESNQEIIDYYNNSKEPQEWMNAPLGKPEARGAVAEIEGLVEPTYLKNNVGVDWQHQFKGTRSPNQRCKFVSLTLFEFVDNVYAEDDYKKIKITIEELD